MPTDDEVERERRRLAEFRAAAEMLVQFADEDGFWRWGDGFGGWVHDEVDRAATERGLPLADARPVAEKRPPLARSLRDAVVARDGLVCRLCGGDVPLSRLHIDHIYPRSLGGVDELDNLQVTHDACNMRKGAR